MRRIPAGALAPFSQFVNPAGAYGLLSERASSVAALCSSLSIMLAVYFLPLIMIDLDSASAELGEGIREQALLDGMSPAAADSAAAAGMEDAWGGMLALPGTMVLERLVMAVLAASSAFAIYRAFGARDGYAPHLWAAVLSQAGFTLVWGALAALETVLPAAAPLARPELLLGDPGTSPGRAFAFVWLVLSGCNPPAIVTVLLWGAGISAVTGRSRSNGLSTASGIYLVSLVLFSTPVFLGG